MGRKRGRRFRRAIDAQKQLEQIEEAQQASRKRKSRKRIDSIAKSKQRLINALGCIKKLEDARREFGA